MSAVVSLGKARKARSNAADKARAAENRVRFGRTKAEREVQSARDDRNARALDGARRDP